MKKYLAIFLISIQEFFVYRLNFVMWRVRQIFVFLIPFFIWRAVLGNGGTLYGYQFAGIMTYLFGTTILRSLVMGSRTVDLGWMINSGYLSIPLLKPLNTFKFFFMRDLADKFYNLSFIVLEIPLILLIFRPPVFLQSHPLVLLLAVCSTLLAIILFFFLNLVFGSLAFWSRDVWAPRFLLMVFMEFATGAMFPLDMLPGIWQKLVLLTPFPYLLFVPLQIYLGIVGSRLIFYFGLQVFWTFVLYKIANYIWHRGLEVYEAEGR